MKKFCFNLLAVVGFGFHASAQSPTPAMDKPPLPPGPLLVRTADRSKWSVTITDTAASNVSGTGAASPSPDASAAAKNKKPTVITVVKTMPIRLVSIASESRGDTTIWCVNEFQVQQDRMTKSPTLFTSASDTYIDFSKSDFPELGWISAKNYAGVQTVGGHQYFVFSSKLTGGDELIPSQRSTLPSGASSPDEAPSLNCVAYVDADTKLPLSMRKGMLTYVYKFDDPPDTPLTPPSNIGQIVDKERARLKQLSRKPPAG